MPGTGRGVTFSEHRGEWTLEKNQRSVHVTRHREGATEDAVTADGTIGLHRSLFLGPPGDKEKPGSRRKLGRDVCKESQRRECFGKEGNCQRLQTGR